VRIHDLRHTFPSVAVTGGKSLQMVGKLLGHSPVQTTARYAHLAAGTVRTAASEVAALISNSMSTPVPNRCPGSLGQDGVSLCS
jgi:integrase